MQRLVRQRYELTNRAIALLLAFFLVFGISSTFAEYHIGNLVSAIENEEPISPEPPGHGGPPLTDTGNGEENEAGGGQNEGEPGYTGGDGENDDFPDLDTGEDHGPDDSSGYENESDYDWSDDYELCDCGCDGECDGDCDEDCGAPPALAPFSGGFDIQFQASGGGTLTANGTSDWSGIPTPLPVNPGDTVSFVAAPLTGNIVLSWSVTGTTFATGGAFGQTTATIVIPASEPVGGIRVTVTFGVGNFRLTFGGDGSPSATGVGAAPIASGVNVPANSSVTFNATPPPGRYILWEFRNDEIAGSSFTAFGGGNSATLTMPIHDTEVRSTSIPGHQVNFSVYNPADASGSVTASYSWIGGSGSLANGGSAPQGATVNFTAPPPLVADAGFLGYEWAVNGIPQPITQSSTFQLPGTLQDDVTVTVTIVRGFSVNFSSTPSGAISATLAGTGASIAGGNIIRIGSEINFAVLPSGLPPGFNTYAYEWRVGNSLQPETDSAFSLTLNASVDVNLTIVRGFFVTYGVSQESSGNVTVNPNITPPPNNLHREGSSFTFTATPFEDAFSHTWTVNGNFVQGGNMDPFTLNNLDSDVDVRVSFVPGFAVTYEVAEGEGTISADFDSSISNIIEQDDYVTFTAVPDTSPVRYRVSHWTVSVGGTVVDTINDATELTRQIIGPTHVRVYFEEVTVILNPEEVTVTGHGSTFISSPTVAIGGTATGAITLNSDDLALLPPGLNMSPGGNSISITSAAPLAYTNNGTFTVRVTRDEVEATLTIVVNLPFLHVEQSPVTIANNALEDFFVVHSNAPGDITITGLPAGLTYSFEPVGGDPNRTRVNIIGTRPEIGGAAIRHDNLSVQVSRGGITATFVLNVNLTPPPRIDSITASPSTLNVSVHGGSPTATFNVIGVNLTADGATNAAEVIASLGIASSFPTSPAWITPDGILSVVVHNETSATVTVPLTIQTNSANTDSRSHNLTVETTIANNVEGTLIINQGGPINLSPSTITISNANRSESISVSGVGVISITNSGGLPSAYVHINFSTADDEDTIEVTSTRPAVSTPAIVGAFTVSFERDGMPATLTINVNLTSLDIPIIDPAPTVTRSAVFGETLLVIPFTGGTAVFPLGGAEVPGVFTWTNTGTAVGNVVGSPNDHSMTFTPTDTDNFATVTFDVPVTVVPADLTVTWPSSITATFGQQLTDATITGGSAVSQVTGESVPGNFVWVTPNDSVGDVPNSPHTHLLNFVPTDGNNFNSVLNHPVQVTVGRATQLPPPAPSANDITAISITLLSIAGAEFSMMPSGSTPDEGDWGTSLLFDGLIPYTDYFFFARFPGDANRYPSPHSGPVTIRTLRAALGGSPSITGNTVYRETLTANTAGLYANPPGPVGGNAVLVGFTFQWYRNGTAIGDATSETYQLVADDIGAMISVRVTVYNTESPNNRISDEVGPVDRRDTLLEYLEHNLPTSEVFTGTGRGGSVEVDPASGIFGMGTVTVYFRAAGTSDPWVLAPTNVGVYDVQIRVADDGARYKAATFDLYGQFQITRITPDLTHLNVSIPADPTTWDSTFLTGGAPYATAVAGSGITGLGVITVWYSLDGGPRTTTPPGTPGTVTVTVDITQGSNFTAIAGLYIGTYTIVGIDIPFSDITITSVNTTFNGNNHQIGVSDSGGSGSVIGTVYFSTVAGGPGGGPWYTTNPLFRNATVVSGSLAPETVYFRVVRQGTGYNPFFGSATVTITQRQLTWGVGGTSSATVSDKVYDGNDSATVTALGTPTLVGVISPDVVTVTAGDVNFAQSDATFDIGSGTYVPVAVTATNWEIGGANASNYLPPIAQPNFANANITRRPLTITGVQATNREFEPGNFTVVLTGGALQNVVPGDNVGFTLGLGTITNANIGDNRPVTTDITLTGTQAGNYTLTQPSGITVNILGTSIVGATINISDVVFNNTAQTPPFTVSFAGTQLVLNTDFEIVGFTNNTNVGTATVTIRGIGNFSNEESETFQITSASITTASVSVSGSYVFSGSAINPPAANVTVNLAPFGNLVHGTDFTFATANNVLVSDTPVVTVTGIGNFAGAATQTGTFTISPHPISGVVTVVPSNLDVNGAIGDGTVLTANIAGLEPSGLLPPNFSGLEFEWFSSVNGGPATPIGTTGTVHTVDINHTLTPSGANIFVRVTGIDNFSGYRDSSFSEVGAIPLTGSISITPTLQTPPVITDFLTLDYSALLPSPPPVPFQFDITWLRDGTVIGTGNQDNLTYTLNANHSDFNSLISAEIIGRTPFTGSVLATAIPIPIARPNAPTNFTATPGPNPGEITLSWTPPELTGGAPIIKYTINGGNIQVTSGTSHVFSGAYGASYTFELRAYNGFRQSEPPVTISATTFHPPEILSIAPTHDTSQRFMNVRGEGETFTAVFNVTGTDLNRGNNINTVRAAFEAIAQSAMVTIGGISVPQISETSATITVSITILPNNQPNERTGAVEVSSFIAPDNVAATTLNIRQFARAHSLSINNSPSGAVPPGQSPPSGRSFPYGATVELIAGNRAGYTFVNWTSSSGVTFANATAATTSFTMPNAPVTVVANWSQGDDTTPPTVTPPGSGTTGPSQSTPTPAPGQGGSGAGGSGAGSGGGSGAGGTGSGTDDTESDGTDPGDIPPEPGSGGDIPPELGNGGGHGAEDGNGGVPTPSPINYPDTAEEQSGAFLRWLRSNIWWIALLIAVLIIVTAWWFILGKKRKKDKEETPVTDLTENRNE